MLLVQGPLDTFIHLVGITKTSMLLLLHCVWIGHWADNPYVMDIANFQTIFFELLVFFTFTLLTLHFAY